MIANYAEAMSLIWHQPDTDNYWLGYSTPNGPTICLLNVGILMKYFADYDPMSTLAELQKLINDWSLAVTRPTDIIDDWTKKEIYNELESPVHLATKLHDCIDTSSLTQLYDYYIRDFPWPPAFEKPQL